MEYYEKLIERVVILLEERLYVSVLSSVSVEGYELTLIANSDESFKKTYKVHYRELERNEGVLSVTQNIVSSFVGEFKDSMYRPN